MRKVTADPQSILFTMYLDFRSIWSTQSQMGSTVLTVHKNNWAEATSQEKEANTCFFHVSYNSSGPTFVSTVVISHRAGWRWTKEKGRTMKHVDNVGNLLMNYCWSHIPAAKWDVVSMNNAWTRVHSASTFRLLSFMQNRWELRAKPHMSWNWFS